MDIVYDAEPTLARFHADDSFVRGIRGPFGSGKSVAAVMEILARATRQAPAADGVRYSRWAVVRNTYPQLKSTTIKTFERWVPAPVCPLRYTAPISGTIRKRLPDGTRLHAEVLFIALDTAAHTRNLLSLELTGAFLNEAREIPLTVIESMTGRVGRYPDKELAPLTWSGIWMDTNPPDDDHWWYQTFEDSEERDPAMAAFLDELAEAGFAYRQFVQPPALLKVEDARGTRYVPNPAAENVAHQQLGYNYWLRMVPGKSQQWIRTYIQGEYGSVFDGRPIYAGDWSEQTHLRVSDYAPPRGSEIIIGWDYGLTPAAVLMQLTPKGVLEVFDEIVARRAGIRSFTEEVSLHLATHWPDVRIAEELGDPSGNAARDTDEESCFQIQRELGHQVRPGAMTLTDRLEGVRYFLRQMVDGEPGFRLSRRCRMLRKGFAGGYRYKETQDARAKGIRAEKPKPEKNQYSHPHDALNHAVGEIYRRTTSQAGRHELPPREQWRRRSGKAQARAA